jgi:hypoxanthine-DNA glycosylase
LSASRGFPPVIGGTPRVLVLGSLPGAASLAAGQYYAHPRNVFWTLMGELAGAGPELPYAQRCDRLVAAGIALWDVRAAARRSGSLDAAIDFASVQPNDFAGLFARYPGLALVAFNGAKAAELYRRLVLPSLDGAPAAVAARLPQRVLPSTSPAHAGRSLPSKLEAWRAALAPVGRRPLSCPDEP